MTTLQAGVQPANPVRVSDEATSDNDRRFVDLVSRIGAMPDADERSEGVMRAWRRAGLVPNEDSADAALLAAWDSWKAAVDRIENLDQNDSYDADIQARDAAEDVLLGQIASTPVGAAVKLRFALDMGGPPKWVSDAIIAGDDMELFARADELSSERRAVVDALALLVRPADRTVRDAFEAWVAAQQAWNVDLRRHGTDDGDALRLEAERLELVLADTPARTPDDVLLKLLPLALNYHSANHGPFALTLEPQNEGAFLLDDKAWCGVIDGMLALSPRIAEVAAMRHVPRADSVEAAG